MDDQQQYPNRLFMPDEQPPELTDAEKEWQVQEGIAEVNRRLQNFPAALGIALAPVAEALHNFSQRPEVQAWYRAQDIAGVPNDSDAVDPKEAARRRSRDDLQKKRRELRSGRRP